MNRRGWLAGLLFLCGLPAAGAVAGDSPGKPELRVGYGEVDITPSLGITMPGYFHVRRASGVLDPLLAKALVLSRGDTTLALVALDLIGIPARQVERIQAAVREETGVPPAHLFLHATHTHTGANPSEIEEKIPGQVAAAVQKALEARVVETGVRLGAAREDSVAFIRRYLMKDGSVRTNPGRGNPEILRPIGTIDPAVHVVAFEEAKSILVSYGLHPDCIGGTRFSADYPHHLTQALAEELGAGWKAIYLNACCGNVNHINVKDSSQRSSYEESRRIGRALARAAFRAYGGARPISLDRMGARAETVQCLPRKVPEKVYRWAREQVEKDPEGASRRNFNEATPSRIIRLAEAEPRPVEIIVMALGPVGIVGLPAEVFVEVGRDIKAHSLFDPTLVIGLTGGSMGYLPHPRGYDEGGYEATYASARWDPRTSILWSDTAVRLLGELKK